MATKKKEKLFEKAIRIENSENNLTDIDLLNFIDWEKIEYVIYDRRSSDEWSWNQVQSIPDQIKICMEYADNPSNNIKLMERNTDYYKLFFNENEEKKEELEADLIGKDILQKSKKYFIIKESHSAKEPWQRPKRNNLIQLIRDWKINWILSYSPDRQSRNLVDWWEIIHLAHIEKVSLKYTNFQFDNNAAGRMMLWIRFVFSKQYVDKLSEDINRWIWSKVKIWQSMWKYKYWYITNPKTHYYNTDGKNFDLMKQAFQMRLHTKKTDQDIVNFLNASWFAKKEDSWDKLVSIKSIWDVRIDPFYYWKYIHWDYISNQLVDNDSYKPMITEDEHMMLIERYKNNKKKTYSDEKTKTKELHPYMPWFITTEDWYSLTPNVPSKWRFIKKLKELQKIDPNVMLDDLVKPHQIKCSCKNKNAKYIIEINFDKIEDKITKVFDKLKVSEETYNIYKKYIEKQSDKINEEINSQIIQAQWTVNIYRWQLNNYIKKNMWDKDKQEKEIYDNHRERLAWDIKFREDKIQELKNQEIEELMNYDMILKFMNNLGKYYRSATYSQKAIFSNICLSNIIIMQDKSIQIKANPVFKFLYQKNGQYRIRTDDLFHVEEAL